MGRVAGEGGAFGEEEGGLRGDGAEEDDAAAGLVWRVLMMEYVA